NWTTVNCNLIGIAGVHDLYFRFTGSSGYLFNIDWFVFTKGTVVTPTATITPTPSGSVTPTPTSTQTFITTPTPTPSATSQTGVSVNYAIQGDWGSGATINVTMKNNGTSAINGWTLAWNFPGNQKIVNLWNGSFTQSGTAVTVKNMSYNGIIPAGGTVSFGFNISYSGPNAKPTAFTLNGTVCGI
ncbi:MAG TPA: cellulose binding domain-containing protein, partial [Bacillota bacterium]|nr:cellulose binding domain-containing protein [Bacillota bacterium]